MTNRSQFPVSLCLLFCAFVTTHVAAQDSKCVTPEVMTRADVPGLGMALIESNATKISLYGYAEHPKKCVDKHTMFEAASLTKPVFAYLVMRLVDRGLLDLDDSLIERLPSLPLPKDDPRSNKVTIRMALSHSSGLEGPDNQVLRFAKDPGTQFRYYPAGYRLVQRVVEHIGQQPLDVLMRREVFAPLNMTSSSLVFRTAYTDRLATRHRMLGDPIKRDRDPNLPANAAASLLTTPDDYGRFLHAILNGTGLRESSITAMLTPQISAADSGDKIGWGIGWGLELERGIFFHWGDDGAAKCFTMGSRNAKRAFVYFTNSYYGMALAGEMSERFFPGQTPAVDWLGYDSWDAPNRLARRDTVRTFIETGPSEGMRTFIRYGRNYPELDMYSVAHFAAWILDSRSQHDGRVRLLSWQLEQRPDDIDVSLKLARSFRELKEIEKAVEVLSAARKKATPQLVPFIDNQVVWLDDIIQSQKNTSNRSPAPSESLVGTYGVRRVTAENGRLFYQRGENKRYALRWMHGTTYAVKGDDSFRIRFAMEDGKAIKLVLYTESQTDESSRTGD